MISKESKEEIDSLTEEELRYEIHLGPRSRYQREKFVYLKARLDTFNNTPQSDVNNMAQISILGVQIRVPIAFALISILILGLLFLWWNWPEIERRLDYKSATSQPDISKARAVYLANVPFNIPEGFEPHGKFNFDKPYFFNRIQISGSHYKHGPVMHPANNRPAKLKFDLSGFEEVWFLAATIGINDENGFCDPNGGSTGSVVFRLWVDDQLVNSWPIERGPGLAIQESLPNGRYLFLEVTDGGDGNRCDGAVWADARLMVK